MSSTEMGEQSGIQVVVRLRPMSDRELKGNTLPVVTASTEKREVTVIKGTGARTLRNTFAFDNVFTSFSTQQEVFDQTLAPVISDVLGGYESTVFAYGQTGTGKTHTMEGTIHDADERGVIPRAAFDVFRRLADESYVEHAVSASFLEIYNEELCDLLLDVDPDDIAAAKAREKQQALRLVEDPSTAKRKGRGMYVMNLTEETVKRPEDVLALMQRASTRRQVGETKMNKQSSRSHCVFTLRVDSKRRMPDGSVMECAGKLHMVDLAGSECAKSAGGDSLDPSRERERKNINQSLLTLGRVITLLKAGGKAKGERIPYRDSKLTRLLQESLGGRCKTCVIATVSPSSMAVDETLSTLQYAQSAHGIINKPTASSMLKVNVDGHARPATAGGNAGNGSSTQDWSEMECRMQYLEAQAEEAAAALARKHAEQSSLIDRAERAEAGPVTPAPRPSTPTPTL
jgi:kinesin family protein 11